MFLELTEQQRRVVDEQAGGPVEVIDPHTRRTYVLIDREQFEKVQTLLQDGQQNATDSCVQVSPIMLQSQRAFWRDLPGHLKNKKLHRLWVCYHGDVRIGFAISGTELVQLCLRRGLERGQFYLGRIEKSSAPPWEVTVLEQSLFEAEDNLQPRPHL